MITAVSAIRDSTRASRFGMMHPMTIGTNPPKKKVLMAHKASWKHRRSGFPLMLLPVKLESPEPKIPAEKRHIAILTWDGVI
ncbi:unnamed protein product [Arabis nemorensis]|uniref:Uncharacterized protein n=1 Tax=Arabis nemorensis TaxID=586526 RepID=A0A565CW97_9BRAS|nr:unnamed protein product [Arabis nemorensis]